MDGRGQQTQRAQVKKLIKAFDKAYNPLYREEGKNHLVQSPDVLFLAASLAVRTVSRDKDKEIVTAHTEFMIGHGHTAIEREKNAPEAKKHSPEA